MKRDSSLLSLSVTRFALTARSAATPLPPHRMAASQGPCPLPSGARLEGIESRDDAPPPPHGNAAWRRGTECERSVLSAKRSSRPCRNKGTRHAQRRQHDSTTEPEEKKASLRMGRQAVGKFLREPQALVFSLCVPR